MYSEELVDLARVLDRLTVGLQHARYYDLDEALHGGNAKMTQTYLEAMESTVPIMEKRFTHLLVEESRPWGVIEVVDGQILVPDWVERQFDGYVDGDETLSLEEIQQARAEGYKILFEPPSVHGYEVNRLLPGVPDSLIEVWWSRADIHVGCGRHNDISGFITKVEGMGWQIFATEQ